MDSALIEGLLLPFSLYFTPAAFRARYEGNQSGRPGKGRMPQLFQVALNATLWVFILWGAVFLVYPSARAAANISTDIALIPLGLLLGGFYTFSQWASNRIKGVAWWMAAVIAVSMFSTAIAIQRGIAYDANIELAVAVDRGITSTSMVVLFSLAAGMWICFAGVRKDAREALKLGAVFSLLYGASAVLAPVMGSRFGGDFVLGFIIFVLTFSHLVFLPLHILTAVLGLLAPKFPHLAPTLWRLSPARWDEFVFWRVPGLARLLIDLDQVDPAMSKRAIDQVLRHPFQAAAARTALEKLGRPVPPQPRPAKQSRIARLLQNLRKEFTDSALSPRILGRYFVTALVGGVLLGILLYFVTRVIPILFLPHFFIGIFGGQAIFLIYQDSQKRGAAPVIPFLLLICLIIYSTCFLARYIQFRAEIAQDIVSDESLTDDERSNMDVLIDDWIEGVSGTRGFWGYIARELEFGMSVSQYSPVGPKRNVSGGALIGYWLMDLFGILMSVFIMFFAQRRAKMRAA